MKTADQKALRVFEEHGGTLRTGEALREGIHPRTLYGMEKDGWVEQLSRGVYRVSELPPPSQPDLLAIGKRVPAAVFCLVTALAYHELTTQVPNAVDVALPHKARIPRIGQPPVRVFWFGDESYQAGVETHEIDGARLRIYGAEKSLADAFKYRNKIGLDVAIEALKSYHQRSKTDYAVVQKYAKICRVANVMRPYLEALL